MATALRDASEMNVQQDCTVNYQSHTEQINAESTVDQSKVVTADDGEAADEGETVLRFTTSVVPEGMTKRQWKKQLRQQRIKEKSKLQKKAKQAAKREKKHKEKEQALKEGRPWPPKRKRPDGDVAPPAKKFKNMSSSDASPIKVAIDFGFEHLMTDKDIKMVMKQCQRCYSQNRRAEAPLQFYWTNFGGRSQERLGAVMKYQNWDVHMRTHGYIEEFGKDNVVFLTSDSPHVLADLDPSKAYIIGGLVDHNHHKGYCFKHAVEQGIAHAQLPILEYIKLNSRAVLAINHVFEILLAFSQNKDWKKSFYEVIPPRKVAIAESADEISDTEVVSQQPTANTDDLNQTITSQTLSNQSFDANCGQDESNVAVNLGSFVQIKRVTEESIVLTCDSDKEE